MREDRDFLLQNLAEGRKRTLTPDKDGTAKDRAGEEPGGWEATETESGGALKELGLVACRSATAASAGLG